MNPNISTAFETLTGREILDMRTENVKHFDLGQGRRQAVIFASPVHFRNAKGAWEEIDNRLVEKTDSKGRRRFETKAGPFRARFFEDADGGSLASLSSGDTEFSWSYPGANISKPMHAKKALRRKFDSELSRRMKVTDRLSDDVTYESLFPGMSVRLTADDLGVKEDIILENKAALRHAVLQLPAEFDYVKNADESVSVLKNGEIRLTIDAPFTYDADKTSIPTAVTLSRAESGVLLRYEINESDLENAAFPVTIDPRVSFSGTHSNVDTNCIHNRKPNASDYSSSYMTTGCSTNSDTGQKYTHMTLLNFKELAAKKASDTILSAQLYMKVSGYSSSYKFVCAYPIKKTWVSEELGIKWEDATWNMLNADTDEYISNRIQSFITRTDTANCVFDITDIYNSWYETDSEGKSKNFGVALARPRDYAGYDLTQFYGSKTYVLANRPYVVVDYVSHAGVKNWWTYETLSCGRAGSANIDLFNGNLVVHHADSSTIGSRMPVSVKHTYNSCQSLSDDFGCGLGWRTSLHQVVREETVAGDTYYIWQDGEGTDHFFKKTTSQPYSDSEGMQLKMHLTDNGLTITDKGDTVMAFEKIGAEAFPCRLKSVTDPHGNRMELYYHENGKLEKVKDGIDRETAFAYNNNGLLSSIAAPGCPVVQYVYASVSGGYNLHKVNYADLTVNQFTEYTYEGSMLTGMKNFDGCELALSYENLDHDNIDAYTEQSRRVKDIEFKNGNVKGTKKVFTYGHMRTDVTNMESDTNGKKITYHFNSNGNVVDVNDEMWYTGGTKYDSGIENTPSSQGRVRRAVVNRIRSTDFHAGWTQTKGNSADKFALDENNLCMSIRGARMIKGGEGESVFTTTAALFEPALHTFSAYIKTTGLTVSSGKKGAFIRVTDGENVYESEAVVEDTSAREINTFANGWQRVYVTFPFMGTPGNTVNVSLVCDASAGTVWFSCPQVEEGEIANMFNLVMNADFAETVLNTANASVTRNYPVGWTDIGSDVGTYAQTGVVFDREVNQMPADVHGNALRMYSQPRYSDIYMGQMIHAYGQTGDVFVLGGWANTESVQGTYFRAKPSIRYRWSLEGGDTTAYYTDWQDAYFTTENGSWQHLSTTIVAPQKYRRIEIAPGYCYNTLTGMFTHFYLHRDLYGSAFTYDDNGNVVNVKDLSNQQSQASYDDYNNLLSYVQPGSASTEKYAFTYGDTEAQKKRHLPLTSTTPMGVKSATTYDQYGNSTANVVQPAEGEPFMRTETVYSSNGNYASYWKDARGNVTNTFTTIHGQVLGVSDPASHWTIYDYDDSNRLTLVSAERQLAEGFVESKNEYEYTNDRLTKISHNTTENDCDVHYTFEYDDLGRKKKVKVNGNTLSENFYSNDRKGQLNEMHFGNGAKVRYEYDDFGRTTAIYVDEPDPEHEGSVIVSDTPKYEFQYDARGIASVIKDNVLMTETRVTSDLADRPSESVTRDANGNLVHKSILNYDGKNRVKEFVDILPESTHKTAYTYDADNRVTEVKYDNSDTHKVNLTYDLLNRITNKAVTNGVPYSTNYTYVAGDTATYGAGATTPLIETITQGDGANAMNFAYAYDSRGNIVSETRNGVTVSYEYDELGQLIRVNDPNDATAGTGGTTWVYSYDRGGNILQKLAYVLSSDAQPSELRQSLIYEYTDANWKDKLTLFCNDELEYDAIGNLTDDGQWTYTWEKGRQLKSMHNASTGVTMEFKYNHEGIRTQKVKKVNGIVTETTDYILKGKTVAAMKKNTDTYYFTYDASGKPVTVNFNGANYTYVKNLQGDIVGILDASGNLVVEYKYDAWGDAVSIYSASTTVDSLAFDNPFRYRGYIWDEETELYYLTSRYYNPEISRFINADSLVSTGQGILSNNMLAYCRNNPVCRKDVTGNAEEDIKEDDSHPITLNEGKIHTGGNVSDGGFNGNNGGKGNSSSSGNNDFWIYRYGYNNASKLVPSEKDMKENSGVSFSLKARPGSAVTTMKAIDGTGVLKAVRDGAYHVSVYPLGGTIKQWYEWGGNSIWTKALESVVIKN